MEAEKKRQIAAVLKPAVGGVIVTVIGGVLLLIVQYDSGFFEQRNKPDKTPAPLSPYVSRDKSSPSPPAAKEGEQAPGDAPVPKDGRPQSVATKLANGGEPKDASLIDSSLQEWEATLKDHFKMISRDIETAKKESKEKGYSLPVDPDKLQNDLRQLHSSIIDSIEKKQLSRAGELINEFHIEMFGFYFHPSVIAIGIPPREYARPPEPGQDPEYDKRRQYLNEAEKKKRELQWLYPDRKTFLKSKASEPGQ